MTAEQWADYVCKNATGPVNITRYACDTLEANIAAAVRQAVMDERAACAKLCEEWECATAEGQQIADWLADAIRKRGDA